MKRKFLLLSITSLFVLSGCQFFDNVANFFKPNKNEQPEQQEPAKDDNQSQSQDLNIEEGEKVDFKQVGEFYGGVVINKDYTGYEFSKSQNKIEKPKSGVGEINIYAFNDFHGAVKQTDDEAGLKAIGTFYKEKSHEANTLILDQGDTWQGSFESNYEYGAIVQDVFNYAGVSLRTVGNHDFDWGLSHLESANNRKLGDDYIPTLAANVYDYANGVNGTTQQSKYGKEYAIFTLDNGLKVGVVGVIGDSQITSICSQLVDTVCFTDYLEKTYEISDYLRMKKACDVVILSAHEPASNMANSGLISSSPYSHKRYVDLILGGHSHSRSINTVGGVKSVQWDSNGQTTGLVTLKYDFENNCLLDNESRVTTFDTTYYRHNYIVTESTINTMVNNYLNVTEPIASEVLSTNFSGYFNSTSLAYLMTEAIYEAVKTAGYEVEFAVSNSARTGFYGTSFTFGDLYKSFPFDNEIILMDINSSTANNSLRRNMTYREDTSISVDQFGHHRIAVIDYIGLHQNIDREYDYFPGAYNVEVFNPDPTTSAPIYRDILKDYLLKNPTKYFNSSDYTDSNPHFATN